MEHALPEQSGAPFVALGQTFPQVLQSLVLVVVFTHVLPHSVGVAAGQAHALLMQVSPAGHAVPHALQLLLLLVVFTHVPLQSVGVAAGQAHAPFTQVSPPLHTCVDPQPPQLFGSVCSLTQAPLHAV
jgi:hypothetical protein